jgi:sterol desaturase/sphingolipid hydroxylase (fatty acid hydroxylase superfamily)
MAILLGVQSGPVPWLVVVLDGTQAYFIHSSVRLNFGPLRYLLCDNRFHRIHHSREEQHRDRNFGTVSPVWDMLFGTAWFPRRAEWPAVGLDETREPQTVSAYLLAPFWDRGVPPGQRLPGKRARSAA